MNKHALFAFSILLAIATMSFAETRIVAVPEFQNQSDRILQVNRWDLAVWTANDLKKTGEFQPLDRKKVNEIIKDANWSEQRLETADEEKLKQNLSATHVLYGTVVRWDVSNMSAAHEGLKGRNASMVSPAVMVVFSFDLVDLSSGKVIKNLMVDASAVGSDENIDSSKQPVPPDDKRYQQLFEDASKKAIRQATQKIAEFVSH